ATVGLAQVPARSQYSLASILEVRQPTMSGRLDLCALHWSRRFCSSSVAVATARATIQMVAAGRAAVAPVDRAVAEPAAVAAGEPGGAVAVAVLVAPSASASDRFLSQRGRKQRFA